MEFEKAYLICRVDVHGNARVINQSDTMKDARYYLSYISKPGDAMFVTHKHPRYEGEGEPQYKSHLISRGNISYEEKEWRRMLKIDKAPVTFLD